METSPILFPHHCRLCPSYSVFGLFTFKSRLLPPTISGPKCLLLVSTPLSSSLKDAVQNNRSTLPWAEISPTSIIASSFVFTRCRHIDSENKKSRGHLEPARVSFPASQPVHADRRDDLGTLEKLPLTKLLCKIQRNTLGCCGPECWVKLCLHTLGALVPKNKMHHMCVGGVFRSRSLRSAFLSCSAHSVQNQNRGFLGTLVKLVCTVFGFTALKWHSSTGSKIVSLPLGNLRMEVRAKISCSNS